MDFLFVLIKLFSLDVTAEFTSGQIKMADSGSKRKSILDFRPTLALPQLSFQNKARRYMKSKTMNALIYVLCRPRIWFSSIHARLSCIEKKRKHRRETLGTNSLNHQ